MPGNGSHVDGSTVREVVEFEMLEPEAGFGDGPAVLFTMQFDGDYFW